MQLGLLGGLCPWLFWTACAVPMLLCSGDKQSPEDKLSKVDIVKDGPTITITTSSGMVRGSVISTGTGKSVSRFLGIPYGMPPVGPMRFRLPRKVKPWTGVLDAFTPAKACYQWEDKSIPGFTGVEIWNANTPMSEDCLNLNIWCPRNATNLSTLLWIYGGGFIYGSPSLPLYDGQTLAAEGNVIVININYRVGPFGFLYFTKADQEAAPGNMGLADQRLALKWVRENIKYFGGDPEKITIFGESAGAAGVSAHLFAKDSWPLFSYAILQSGFITAPWAYKTPEKANQKSLLLAEKCNCTKYRTQKVAEIEREKRMEEDSVREIVHCLRGVPASVVQAAADKFNLSFMEFSFAIVSQDNHFFKGDIFELMKEGRVKNTSILIGSNTDEGTFWLSYLNQYFNHTSQGFINKSQFDESVNSAFPYFDKLLQYAISYHYQSVVHLSYNWHNHRLRHDRHSEATLYRDALKRMVSDYYFNCDVLHGAAYLARQGCPVYAYYFTERSSTNPWPHWMGVMHGYEIEYMFGLPIRQPQDYSPKEVAFSRFMINYWSNFAKNGVPTLSPKEDVTKWPLYGEDRVYMTLSSKGNHLGANLSDTECKIWRNATSFCQKTGDAVSPTSSFGSPERPFSNSGFRITMIFTVVFYKSILLRV